MVAREITITFDELLRRPLIEDYLTLCCVSNPVGGPYIGNAKWLGASYGSLIRAAGPLRGADQLLCTSVDGFTVGTPLAVVLAGAFVTYGGVSLFVAFFVLVPMAEALFRTANIPPRLMPAFMHTAPTLSSPRIPTMPITTGWTCCLPQPRRPLRQQ